MEIGHMLKEEREAQQLTLDDIQEMTKIQKRYLQAIEDNNFSSLPGRFYARAFNFFFNHTFYPNYTNPFRAI